MPEQAKLLELRELFEGEAENYDPIVDQGLISQVRDLVDAEKQARSGKLLLSWEGSKVPRGVTIQGKTIAWTQHGIVRAEGGGIIGYYDRVEQWAGPEGNRHKMIISLNDPDLKL